MTKNVNVILQRNVILHINRYMFIYIYDKRMPRNTFLVYYDFIISAIITIFYRNL